MALGGGRRPWSRRVPGALLGQDAPLGRGHVPSAAVAGESYFGIGFLAKSLSAATFRAENKAFYKQSQRLSRQDKVQPEEDGPLDKGCSQERLGLALREALLWAVSSTGDPQTASELAPAQSSP